MKSIRTLLVMLLVAGTCSILFAQLSTTRTPTQLQFLENNNSFAFLGTDGSSIFLTNTKDNGFISFQSDNTFFIRSAMADIRYTSKTDQFFYTNNALRMTLSSAGRLGLGTISPNAYLEVEENSATNFGHILLSETGPNDFARLAFRNTGSSGNDSWELAGKAAGASNTPLFNIFYNNGTSGADILSIRGDTRKVAINDGTPDYTLEVNHGTSATGNIFTGGNGFLLQNTGPNGHDWLQYVANSDGSFVWLRDNNTVRAQIHPDNGNWVPGSDRKLKKLIQTMETDQLSRIMDLRPTSYQFKDQQSDRISFGLIAQEVQEVYPNIVVSMGEEGQQLGVSYTELIPVLIAGLQEQQQLIEDQNEKIKQIEQELRIIKDRQSQGSDEPTFEGEGGTAVLTGVQLDQNQPNPFSENTRIRYFLPEETNSASLLITNLEGRQLKRIDIDHGGEGTVILQANELPAGMYLYTLLVDGEISETRRMLLTSGN